MFHDPADLHRTYIQVGEANEFMNLTPDQPFRHSVGRLMVHETPLIAGVVTPTRVLIGEGPDLLLIVMSDGALKLSSRAGTVHSQAGGVILAPKTGFELEVGGERCAISLQPKALAKVAAAMAGPGSRFSQQARQRFQPFSPVALQAIQPQASAIHAVIRTIDRCFAVGPQVAKQLGLDDLIHRIAATLLQPELLTEEPADSPRLRERSGRDAFDELIDYIRANLDQPCG